VILGFFLKPNRFAYGEKFFTEKEFHEWDEKSGKKLNGWTKAYYKGLAKWDTDEFAEFLSNTDKYLFKVTMENAEDDDAIDLAFNGQRADDRKEWLETPADNFDDFIVEA